MKFGRKSRTVGKNRKQIGEMKKNKAAGLILAAENICKTYQL